MAPPGIVAVGFLSGRLIGKKIARATLAGLGMLLNVQILMEHLLARIALACGKSVFKHTWQEDLQQSDRRERRLCVGVDGETQSDMPYSSLRNVCDLIACGGLLHTRSATPSFF